MTTRKTSRRNKRPFSTRKTPTGPTSSEVKMKKTDKKFYWHFETVFDHEVTPEEFEEVTGFKWEKRLEYLDRLNSDCSEYAGCSDISSLYPPGFRESFLLRQAVAKGSYVRGLLLFHG